MLARLLLVLPALAAAQEVIAADGQEGVPHSQAAPVVYQTHYTHHSTYNTGGPVHPTSASAYYSQSNQYSNSNGNTGTLMAGIVSIAYALLGVAVIVSCCTQRRYANAGPAAPGVYTQFDVDQSILMKPVAELDAVWRKAFIGKVYTLLAMQIGLTFFVSYAMMQFGGYGLYMWTLTDGAWTRMGSFIFALGFMIAMFCYKQRYPMNLALLLGFTLCMAWTIGCVTTAYAAAGMQMIVLEAFALTSIIFVGLTLFTLQSKIDFSYLGIILPMCLFTLIIWGLFMSFCFDGYSFRQTYALLGTIIFCLYVLYDTWMITQILSYDDYVIGCINLYLDFINIFMFILSMLTGNRE